jgi:hypothetical protein
MENELNKRENTPNETSEHEEDNTRK